MKRLLAVAVIATLTGCEGTLTKNTGVPFAVGSTRESIPATVASIEKLAGAQKDCYARPSTSSTLEIADIKALSPTGQGEYFRMQTMATLAREIRLAAGKQASDPCADMARAYYAVLQQREAGKWQSIGTGLKVIGLGLGIYATGNAIASVVGAAAAGGGDRIVNIGGSRGASTSNPSSAPAGSTPTPPDMASSGGNDSIVLSGATLNLGDKAVIGAGSGAGLTVSGPIGFENFRWLSGSGILSGTSPQPVFQPNATTPTNNISPANSTDRNIGLLN